MISNSSTGETDERSIATGEPSGNRNCTYWTRDDGRDFLTDPNGEIVNLSRLTAYADHGKAIHEAEAHHELPLRKINAPQFIEPLLSSEHHEVDHGEVEMVDGIPLVRAES